MEGEMGTTADWKQGTVPGSTSGTRRRGWERSRSEEGSGRGKVKAKALFGCDGPIPLGDHFCCENGRFSILKWSFVWDN